MKTLALIATGLMIAPAPARADQPGQDWISIGQAERVLHREGYRLIEIEPEDDHWEGEATRHGRTWDFRMSPKTGRIIAMEPDTD
ncbi:hypothetical protein ASG37_16830 [Sphingomonas sp. Leaf407]|uniref:PepSY domain-containing protein n=1 Tax=unclassified Sphingomonas TaxID=196159 RepID=UPI0006FCA3EF|nr:MULTISPECIES: PepSY domain-containing protein [unclassified Sphingomonas]KQN39856.1 hypothetical protein ASE97_16820 [Sphingomonas sp. Leaf42]KQT23642.1 hypothetical protein ASG37_16830 [Sphingomonas sp. Leaf407]